ncbi:DUF222 domain-containing protein [Gordonia sp. FQ]|uniref:DUF222 domain-containing protein n=1 Tax=Gordonia sp. FQ TaxID=3446634 RepID=UPI003F82F592
MYFGDDTPVGLDDAGAAPLTPDQLETATGVSLPDDPMLLWQIIDTAMAVLGDTPLASGSVRQVADMAEISERVRRRHDGLSAGLYAECNDRSVDRATGYLTMISYLAYGHRLGLGQARARTALANRLAHRTALTGETLDPVMPAAAVAVADGLISARHVEVISAVLAKIPECLGPQVIADAEERLVQAAKDLNPKDLARVGAHLLAYLNPDGDYTDPEDRQRRRDLTVYGQDDDLMSEIDGHLTPSARAKLDLILTTWAAPGVNNPADPDSPHPAGDEPDADALAAARERDTRAPGQRRHDAFEAALDFVIAHGGLGKPGTISTDLVITVSDADLARHAGIAQSATGTLIPVSDLIELASRNQARPYLAVFRDHTSQPLYLGRGRRSASKAQRLMLFARDRGCTAPACDMPFARTEAHHSPRWENDGRTDIDALGAACGGHNRAEGPLPGHWTTDILHTGRDAGRMVWRPTGARRPWNLNPLHHPQRLAEQIADRVHGPPHPPGTPATHDAVRRNDSRSIIEKEYEPRLGLTRLWADPETPADHAA